METSLGWGRHPTIGACPGRSRARLPAARPAPAAAPATSPTRATPSRSTVADMARGRRALARALQREFRRAFGETPARVPPDPPPGAGRSAAAHDRPARSTEICLRGRACSSLGSFTTSFTRTYGMSPERVPGRVPAGGRPGAGAGVRRAAPTAGRRHRTFREAAAPRRGLGIAATVTTPTRRTRMMRIANAQLWVHDQEEALAFYTEKVGMEVRADVTAPRDRRLPLAHGRRRRGRTDVAIVLMADPGPAGDGRGDRRRRCATLMAQGLRRHGVPHHRRLPRHLRGAERPAASSSSTTPEERPYGIDCRLPRPLRQPPAPHAGHDGGI